MFLHAQYRRGKSVPENFASASVEAGITTFFGDIDEGAAQGDLSNNLAYKVKASYTIKHVIDFSGNISFGGMSGEKIRGSGDKTNYVYFENKFTQFSFDMGINILAPFMKNNREKFGLYANIGLGLIDFKVKLYDGTNDSVVKTFGYDGQGSTTELVIPFGGRAIYHISKSSAVTLQTTLNWVDTDKLDSQTGNDNTDFYNYFSLGYTYKFNFDKSKKGKGSLRGSGSSRSGRSRKSRGSSRSKSVYRR